ncbi:MAG: N-glycosylase/DNA lyase [Candidatus Diapherotrites archaeon]|nr:N-glycosylase/DNA lyase [Candidatus Diapherotrites archaeon]
MRALRQEISRLKKSPVKRLVDKRIRDFKKNTDFFSELCFCLLTANTSAELGIKCQKECRGFKTFPEKKLAAELKSVGYRFYNRRAGFIVGARGQDLVLDRDWLVKNIKGIGMKEASHFLRNVGLDNYAIIDFHILDLLARHGLIKKPKALTKKKYLEIEKKLAKLADSTGLSPAELDLYLWHMETGKVLK